MHCVHVLTLTSSPQQFTRGIVIISPEPTTETCTFPRECDTTLISPCLNNGTCIAMETTGSYNCSCASGFFGQGCQYFDACSLTPCVNGGICQVDILNKNQFVCTCPEGTTGEMCEVLISPCASSPCMNLGTCIEQEDGFVCACEGGFTGLNCEMDIDVCRNNTCLNGGTCSEGDGLDFSCECLPEFSGEVCETQVIFCTENSCANGGACNELTNGFNCSCTIGYTGDNCEIDINECDVDSCNNNATCVNLPGSYACICKPGFTGRSCNVVIDFCANTSCSVNGNCRSLSDGFVCDCNAGYTGAACDVNIDECDPSPCLNNANCTEGINVFMCVCQPGFTGQFCQINIDDCTSSPCAEDATCRDDIDDFICECPPGFSGKLCDIQTDFCLDNPCFNGNCSSIETVFMCTCPPGWTGDRCQYALSVAVKLSSCGLSGAADILAVEGLAANNQPIAFNGNSAPVTSNYEITESYKGIYWSGWVWQDGGVAILFSLSDDSISAQLESDIPNQQLIFYYTSVDNFDAPASVTFSNVPLKSNQWQHITIAIFNSAQIFIAIDTEFTQRGTITLPLEGTFEFLIPLDFSLALGTNAPLLQDVGAPFSGIMRGVALAGIREQNSFDITNIESCLLNCVGDLGLCSNGQCRDQFAFDRLCVCTDGFTGLQCNYFHTRFQVSGSGSIQTTSTSSLQAIDFKPSNVNGQLVAKNEQKANVTVSVNNGSIEYNRNYCDSTQQSVTAGIITSDLQWHTLSITDSVQLDSAQSVPLPEPTQPACNASNSGRVTIGQSFQGCFRDIEFDNNQLLDSTSVDLQGDALFGCSHDTAHFFTISYLQLPEFISRESQTISLEFNTLSDNGTLYFSNRVPSDATGNTTIDFVAITIESGRVRFSFNLGEQGAETIVESAGAYNDGRWHRLQAVQNMTMATLTVDGETVSATSTASLNLLDTTGSVYVGGSPQQDDRYRGYNGCVRDLEQNGVATDLQDNVAVQNVRFGTCN